MLTPEKGPVIVVPGGGSGPLTIEDALLELTPNVVSITAVTDNGGHTKEVRSVLGVSATGDIVNRMAVHIRNNEGFRRIFLHRFSENGNKASNLLIAAAEKEQKTISKGVKTIESGLKDYVGRVIPISDENIHLRVLREDGTFLYGEESLDSLGFDSPIIDIDFTKLIVKDPPFYEPINPRPNEEALHFLKNCDAILIPPGSWWGSIMADLKIPGVCEAIRESRAPLVWIGNAAWAPETPYWNASDFVHNLRDTIGRRIDFAIINSPDHNFPLSYRAELKFPVRPDIAECELYADKVIKGALTHVEDINKIPTIRHKGPLIAEIIMKLIN